MNKYEPYTEDLSKIVEQLSPLFAPEGVADLTDDQKAFEDLKRLAGLQATTLHSGQAIKRQIDSMIKSWRRTAKFGGASNVQAAHFIDALQQVRHAIFGEYLANDEGEPEDEIKQADIEQAFSEFVTKNSIEEKDLEAARRGFEAAYFPDEVLFLKTGVVKVNGDLYVKMTDDQIKKYGVR
jgi:hypothetical protein